MPSQISQATLSLHKLANLLEQKLLTLDKADNIRATDTKIDKNNITLKKIIDALSLSNITDTSYLHSNIQLLEKTFNQSIGELKKIKSFIILAKQASLEPEPSFHNHSLISPLEILNTFYIRKKTLK